MLFQPQNLEQLISHLKRQGVLKSAKIEAALRQVDRKNFIPAHLIDQAYADRPLPLAEGQTISQPTTVVFMLELLDVRAGQKVLDIGAGSGWVSCLLAELVGDKGEVYALEINKTVAQIGLKNIKNFGASNIVYRQADAAKVWADYAPYDRIHCAAAFDKIPTDLLNQLTVGGVLVAPTQDNYIYKIIRQDKNNFSQEKYFGFVFVPFVKKSPGGYDFGLES